MSTRLQRIAAIAYDTSLAVGLAAILVYGTVETVTGPPELDAEERVALDTRFAPVEARQQARAEVLAQAAERYAHPSAGLPTRRRHSSTTQGEQ